MSEHNRESGVQALAHEFFEQDDIKRLAEDAGILLECPLLIIDETLHILMYHLFSLHSRIQNISRFNTLAFCIVYCHNHKQRLRICCTTECVLKNKTAIGNFIMLFAIFLKIHHTAS